jgi:hypothetical protein
LISLYLNATRLFQSPDVTTIETGLESSRPRVAQAKPCQNIKQGMVCSCPGWSPEETLWNDQLYGVLELVDCSCEIQKPLISQNVSEKKN